MRCLPWLVIVTGLALSATAQADTRHVSSEPAWQAKQAPPLLAPRIADYPNSNVARLRFAELAAARIEQLKAHNRADASKRYQIGIERAVAAELASASAPALRWQPTADRGQVARFAATSPAAAALRIGLDVHELPAGAELRFFGERDRESVVAPVAAAEIAALRREHPIYWTPVTEGATQTVELYVPAGADLRQVRLTWTAVSHLVVSPFGELDLEKIGESQPCQIDVRCVSNPSTAFLNAKAAVARMLFQTGGGTATCTGTLLNDTDTSTQIPHFFSAAHCFTSQSVANTLTTLWFQEASACGSGVEDSGTRQVAGGAQIEFADAASDVLLVRLNNNPPSGAVFGGWDANPVTVGSEIAVIHHPSGDVKKVSLGQVTGQGGSSLASGQFLKVGYTSGSTEGGSSGSALLTFTGSEFVTRGGLLGGAASCGNSGSLSNPNNSDDFSRLDLAFSNLRQYLAPASTPQPPSNIDYSGAWAAPGQSGWGLIVLRGASGVYAMYIYHYNQSMLPTWYLMSGNLSGTTFQASILQFRGPWFGTVPFSESQVSAQTVGNITVNFASASTATINFTIDGRSVSTSINRLSF